LCSELVKFIVSSKLNYHCLPWNSCALVIPFDDIVGRNDGIALLRSFLESINGADGGILAAFDVSTSNAEGNVIFTPKMWDCCYSNEGIVGMPAEFSIRESDLKIPILSQCNCLTKKNIRCKRKTYNLDKICWQHRIMIK